MFIVAAAEMLIIMFIVAAAGVPLEERDDLVGHNKAHSDINTFSQRKLLYR